MSRKIEVDPLQVMAMTVYAGALLERCHEMVVRLTTARSFADEVDDFRDQAIRHVAEAVIAADGYSSADIANAKKYACEAIEDVCSAWLREWGSSSSDERKTVN